MATFQEDDQIKKLEELREQEEEDLVRILAETRYHLPYVNLASIIIDNEALSYLTEAEARKLEVAPFKVSGKHIYVGVRSPNHEGLPALRDTLMRKALIPTFYMVSQKSLNKVWERYTELSHAAESRIGGLDIESDRMKELGEKIHRFQDVQANIADCIHENKPHKISQILEIILAGGISLDASDVHIEPEETDIRIRYRLDGVLQDVASLDIGLNHLLNARLKLLAGMKLTNSAMAQDGRISIFLDDMEISLRVSTVPGTYGESIVMRILNPKKIKVKPEDLGIDPKLFEIIDKEIHKPNGMILITGPTGSGKTTTLYAFLQRIYNPEIKVITIEDPIEYHLKGITQTQTEKEKGYGFLQGLRAALRQDPDVIMVGEIRDAETAQIAVESALTGHIVFSTLHTNNAGGVIPRMIDLEVNPKILVSALSLSMAQRTVRRLCPHCKVSYTPTTYEETILRNILKMADTNKKGIERYNLTPDMPITLYKPVGCDLCHGIGYKGLIGIFEAILTDEAIEKIIPTNPSEREIKKVAKAQGIFDMREDGMVKILSGITSFEEVRSVVDLEEEI